MLPPYGLKKSIDTLASGRFNHKGVETLRQAMRLDFPGRDCFER